MHQVNHAHVHECLSSRVRWHAAECGCRKAQVNRRGVAVHFEVWDTLTPKTFMVSPQPSAAASSRAAMLRLSERARITGLLHA